MEDGQGGKPRTFLTYTYLHMRAKENYAWTEGRAAACTGWRRRVHPTLFLAPSATERDNRGYEKRPQRSQADMPRLFVYMCENAFERPPRTPVSLEEWNPAAERMGREDRLRSRVTAAAAAPRRSWKTPRLDTPMAERIRELDEEPEYFQSSRGRDWHLHKRERQTHRQCLNFKCNSKCVGFQAKGMVTETPLEGPFMCSRGQGGIKDTERDDVGRTRDKENKRKEEGRRRSWMCRRAFGRRTVRQETGGQDSTQEKRGRAKREYAATKSRSTLSRGRDENGTPREDEGSRWQWHGARTESAQKEGKGTTHQSMNLWAFFGGVGCAGAGDRPGFQEGQRDVDVFGVLPRELGVKHGAAGT
ncbi:hypothetical protein K438DRAFT_1774186 [Mycena galopus ATCC 62051]|nr:hypothetical protein K438DRAFT_1774186 [Mycena galopus ATCC 62051]